MQYSVGIFVSGRTTCSTRFLFCKFLPAVTVLIAASEFARAQSRPVSFHARALMSRYHATNRGEWSDPAGAYFFAPSIGANGEAMVRYRPDSSRLFFETGLCVWVWHYRAVLNTRSTQTQYHQWMANNGGASFGIPVRAGVHLSRNLSLSAGVLLLHNVSSARLRRLAFQSSIHGENLDAEASITGVNRSSLAFDLTAGFRLSRRLDVVLRAAWDTKDYPAVEAYHQVTRNGLTRYYSFTGAPKLASVGVGLGVIL